MDQESHVVLKLEDPKGPAWILTVCHKRSVTEPLKAVAAAAKEFLATPQGRQVADSNGGDFNYGDAVNEIPLTILRNHGIMDLAISDEAWTANHDHNFAAEPDAAAARGRK